MTVGYDMHTVDDMGRNIHRGDCTDESHGDHYWRRNIFGGGAQADRLEAAGMGFWPREGMAGSVPGKWPEADEYGITANDAWEGSDDDPNDPQWHGDPAKIAEYEAAVRSYMKQTYDERPGIALYKLCHSNDGWWVTKAECESALKLWEANGSPKVDEYDDTIPFLRASAAHDGFRVY
jgi:hypothetical protein